MADQFFQVLHCVAMCVCVRAFTLKLKTVFVCLYYVCTYILVGETTSIYVHTLLCSFICVYLLKYLTTK